MSSYAAVERVGDDDVEALAHRDLGGVAPEPLAVRGEDVELAGELVGGDVRFDSSAYWATMRSVFFSPLPPIMIGIAADRRGVVDRVLDRVVLAVERGARRGASQDDLQRLLEPLEALLERAELEAERVVLELEPARADAKLRPAAEMMSSVVMILASSAGLR